MRPAHQLRRVTGVASEVHDHQHQLGSDEGADDAYEAHIEDPLAVQTGAASPVDGVAQGQDVGRGQDHAVAVDADETEIEQEWIHRRDSADQVPRKQLARPHRNRRVGHVETTQSTT